MALRQAPIALDTQVLIMYLEDRPPVADLIAPIVERTDTPVVISAVTLAEILVLPARSGDPHQIDTLRHVILELPSLRLVSLTEQIAAETALIRGQFGLPLPDSAIIASARQSGAAALIGNDRRWRGKQLGVPYHHLDEILAL